MEVSVMGCWYKLLMLTRDKFLYLRMEHVFNISDVVLERYCGSTYAHHASSSAATDVAGAF